MNQTLWLAVEVVVAVAVFAAIIVYVWTRLQGAA